MNLVIAVVAVFAVTLLYTLFIRSKDIPPADPVSPTQHLDERKAAIYENLRDLQFEYRVGKLSDSDYQTTKLTLQKELAVVIASIEQIAPSKPPSSSSQSAPKPASAAAAAPGVKREPPSPKQLEDGSACPHCGAQFARPMKFCGECGKAMA
jgi:hypothetical protein